MIAIKAHFDGKVIVPDEPLHLPVNQSFVVRIEDDFAGDRSALSWLAENAVDTPACPTDLAQEHDHYLYGTTKRSEEK